MTRLLDKTSQLLLRNIASVFIMFPKVNSWQLKIMEVRIRTAETYAIGSELRPGQLKLGLSNIPGRRRGELNAADPSCFIAATFPFLDAYAAEKKAQKHFKHRHVDGEWFRVTLEEVREFYRQLQDAELPEVRTVLHAASYFKNHEGSPLNRATANVSDELTVLLQRQVASTGLTVGEAVRAAMTSSTPLKIVVALQRAGLMIQKTDGLAVLDRTRGGSLEQFFNKTKYAQTWRKRFASIAGFTAEGECVKMSSWKKTTSANQEVLDRACAQ